MQRSPRRRRRGGAIASWYLVDQLEPRTLLSAVVASPDPVTYADAVTGPLAARPGHSLYVSGYTSKGNSYYPWTDASAITPNLTNDLVLNANPSKLTYTPQNEGGPIGLLTNGTTQTQVMPAPSAAQPAIGDGGSSDASSNLDVVVDAPVLTYSSTYKLGTAGNATPNATGYDVSEIDVITGHSDYRTGISNVDILVEPAGSSQFLSLSGGKGFSLTGVPDGNGGLVTIDRGSAQMAIVNDTSGQPIATNIQAVQFVVQNCQTYFRELVVTGTPSGALTPAPAVPAHLTATYTGGAMNLTWDPASDAIGYVIERSDNFNSYVPIGSVFGQTSFIDTQLKASTSYNYEVIACGNGDSMPSDATPFQTIAVPFGATFYLFSKPMWQGGIADTVSVPDIGYSGGGYSPQFPLPQNFNPSSFSAMVEGKITTDLAGIYTFLANTDDDGYLYVNGQLVSANPSTHPQQDPTATYPISLRANMAYDFVFLENNPSGPWGMHMYWREPQADGSPGPVTLVPQSSLSPAVDSPPVPSAPTAMLVGTSAVQLTWAPVADASSDFYTIQRATVNASGTIGYFSQVGEVFSGPGASGATQTWGASGYLDTSVLPNQTYVYKLQAVSPDQPWPIDSSPPSQPVSTPAAVSASLVSGIMHVMLPNIPGDIVSLWTSGTQYQLRENDDVAAFFDQSAVAALVVDGTPSGAEFDIDAPVSLSGAVDIAGTSDIQIDAPVSASEFTIQSAGIDEGGSMTSTGPITLNATTLAVVGSITTANAPISIDCSKLYFDGPAAINPGSGDLTYVFSGTQPVNQGLTNDILYWSEGSGTTTIASTATSAVFSAYANSALHGRLVLDLPNASVSISFLDTTGGNTSLNIIANSLSITGPLNTGNGALTIIANSASLNGAVTTNNAPISISSQTVVLNSPLSAGTGTLTMNAPVVEIGAPVTAGNLTTSSGNHVSIDAVTITIPGNVSNGGSMSISPGSTVKVGGSFAGSGSVSIGYPPGVGTVAYYRFEGTPNMPADVIPDASGDGLDATAVNGPVYAASVPVATIPVNQLADRSAMQFDGATQRIFIPDNSAFQLTGSMTLEAYINVQPSLAKAPEEIISRADDTRGADPYSLAVSGNTLVFQVTNASKQTAELTATISQNTWMHLAGTLDDATGLMCLYVNGRLIASQTTAVRAYGMLTGSEPGLGIGGPQSGALSPQPLFHGLIDEVRISNIALMPDQLLDAPAMAPGSFLSAEAINASSISIASTGVLDLLSNAVPMASSTGSLTIAPGGLLDLADNVLEIDYSNSGMDPMSTIRGYLNSAYDRGAWDGWGITSLAAAANPAAYGIGYADSSDGNAFSRNPDTIELKFTLNGDTNLDGSVTLADLLTLTRHFGKLGSWDTGDFNYDGAVNLSDFLTLAREFGQTLTAYSVLSTSSSADRLLKTHPASRAVRRVQ